MFPKGYWTSGTVHRGVWGAEWTGTAMSCKAVGWLLFKEQPDVEKQSFSDGEMIGRD